MAGIIDALEKRKTLKPWRWLVTNIIWSMKGRGPPWQHLKQVSSLAAGAENADIWVQRVIIRVVDLQRRLHLQP